jgi:uncharacterized protein YuzE
LRLIYDAAKDTLMIRLYSAAIASSERFEDGVTVLFDKDGHVLGFDVSHARDRMTPEELTGVSYENAGTKQRASLRLP